MIATIPRVWAAVFDHGMIWADEVYQSVEQGHRLAFGYGFIPWEFQSGARSWVFPGVLAGILKTASSLGVDSGIALVSVAKLVMAALSVLAVYLSMRLASVLGTATSALFAGIMSATFPLFVIFGSRCLSENPSAVAVIGIAYLLARRRPWDATMAGALSGLIVFLRFTNGFFAVGFFVILLMTRRWRDLRGFALAAVAVSLLGGLLDHVAWGRPFHSLVSYFNHNFNSNAYSPAVFESGGRWQDLSYLDLLWWSSGLSLVPIAIGLVAGWRRGRSLLLLGICYLALLEIVRHKELRFILPVLPLFIAVAAARLGSLWDQIPSEGRWKRVRSPAAIALSLALTAYCANQIARVSFFDLGYSWGRVSPWQTDDVNRLLARAHEDPELCGLVFLGGPPLSMNGGFSYLHRDVFVSMPVESIDPTLEPAANAIITHVTSVVPSSYREVARWRRYVLLRRAGGCAPPPTGDAYRMQAR